MFDYLLSSYFGSLLYFSLGLSILYLTVKFVNKDKTSVFQPYTSGLIGGAGFIFIGIFILIMKLSGKW